MRQKLCYTYNYLIFTISLLVSAVVMTGWNTQNRRGLSMLFLLPVCFGLIHLLYFSINMVLHSGIGVKVYYAIMVVRYLLVPLMITLTDGAYNTLPITMPMVAVSEAGYQFSVIAMLIELIVASLSIRYYSRKLSVRYTELQRIEGIGEKNKGFSATGFVFVVIILLMLSRRNINSLMSTFSFFTIEEKYQNATSDAYGIVLALTLKSIIFLAVLNCCLRKYQKSNTLRWVFLALIISFLNIAIFFGYNRSLVLETAIATIYVLYLCFPRYKKMFMCVLVPVISLIMVSMIVIKQFGVAFAQADYSSLINFAELSNTIECYVCGPWAEGCGYDAAVKAVGYNPLEIFIKDFIANSFISYLPGFTWTLNLFPDVMRSTELHQQFSNSWQMLPLTAQCVYYVGPILAPALSSGFTVLFIKILMWCDYKGKYCIDLYKKYAYTLTALLFSFSMCYTWVTLLWCFTKTMLFVFVFIFLNEYHYIGNGRLKRYRTE